MKRLMKKAMDKVLDTYSNLYVRMAYYGVVAGSSGYATAGYLGDPLFHLSGFVSSLITQTIDIASTLPSIRLMNSHEFSANGLDEFYGESNWIIRQHPTEREFYKRGVITTLIAFTMSTIAPTIGYSYLSTLPLTVINNKRFESELREDLEAVVKGP